MNISVIKSGGVFAILTAAAFVTGTVFFVIAGLEEDPDKTAIWLEAVYENTAIVVATPVAWFFGASERYNAAGLAGLTAPFDAVRERLTIHELHRYEAVALVCSELVDRANARMVEARRDSRLSLKALSESLVGQELLRQDFERYASLQLRLPRLVDDPHCAVTYDSADFVTTEHLTHEVVVR